MSESGDKKASHFDFTLDEYRPKKKPPKKKSSQILMPKTNVGGHRGKSPSGFTLDGSWSEASANRRCCLTWPQISLCIFIFLVIALLSVIAATIYIGVATSDQLQNNLHIRGKLRVISGDTYNMMLEDSRSAYYQHKIKQYENKLTTLYKDSLLKNSIQTIRVYGFRNGSLIVLFGIFVDRMTIKKDKRDSKNVMMAVKKVLMDELMSTHPKVFGDVMVDPHSIVLSEELADMKEKEKSEDHHYYIMHNEDEVEKQQTDKPTEAPPVARPSTLNQETTTMLLDMYRNEPLMTPSPLRRPSHDESLQDMYKSVDRVLELSDKPRNIDETTDRDPMEVLKESNEEIRNINFNYDPWKPLVTSEKKQLKVKVPSKSVTLDDIPPRGKPYNILPRGKPSVIKPVLPKRDEESNKKLHKSGSEATNSHNKTLEDVSGTTETSQDLTEHLTENYTPQPEEKASSLRKSSLTSNNSSSLNSVTSSVVSTSVTKSQIIGNKSKSDANSKRLASTESYEIPHEQRVKSNLQNENSKDEESDRRHDIGSEYINERRSSSMLSDFYMPQRHTIRYKRSGAAKYDDVDRKLFIDTRINDKEASGYGLYEKGTTFTNTIITELATEATESSNFLKDSTASVVEVSVCQNGYRCRTGECISKFNRCNQIRDCWDNSDETGCKCVEKMRAMLQEHKICDGVPDCADYSDEQFCEYCKPDQFKCPNSRRCINQSQVCDGLRHCPDSADEAKCMMLSPGPELATETKYNDNGYLLVRRSGIWGHMCMDRFNQVQSESGVQLSLFELGHVVCNQLTYKNVTEVRIVDVNKNNMMQTEYYYNFQYSKQDHTHTIYSRSTDEDHRGNDLLSLLPEKKCLSQKILHVTCTNLECGVRPNNQKIQNYRIVGGENAEPGSWPWHAALYKEGKYQCGASLISDRWLISAAHCFNHYLDKFWVARLGLLRRGAKNIRSPFEVIRKIKKIYIHKNYVETGFVNDITLLEMDQPVEFSDFIRPVCLPKADEQIIDGKMCTVIGWGQLYEVGSIYPDTLQEVRLPIITTEACRKRTVFRSIHSVTDHQFCAGYERGGRDACVGDSGGPILCQGSTGQWTLLGVTSNGFGCARPGYPGVYTKVSDYLKWIAETIESKNSSKSADTSCFGHRCPLGKCLPLSQVCDGYVQCQDGSDEDGCNQKSARVSFIS